MKPQTSKHSSSLCIKVKTEISVDEPFSSPTKPQISKYLSSLCIKVKIEKSVDETHFSFSCVTKPQISKYSSSYCIKVKMERSVDETHFSFFSLTKRPSSAKGVASFDRIQLSRIILFFFRQLLQLLVFIYKDYQ
jgi:hypothetical protein